MRTSVRALSYRTKTTSKKVLSAIFLCSLRLEQHLLLGKRRALVELLFIATATDCSWHHAAHALDLLLPCLVCLGTAGVRHENEDGVKIIVSQVLIDGNVDSNQRCRPSDSPSQDECVRVSGVFSGLGLSSVHCLQGRVCGQAAHEELCKSIKAEVHSAHCSCGRRMCRRDTKDSLRAFQGRISSSRDDESSRATGRYAHSLTSAAKRNGAACLHRPSSVW